MRDSYIERAFDYIYKNTTGDNSSNAYYLDYENGASISRDDIKMWRKEYDQLELEIECLKEEYDDKYSDLYSYSKIEEMLIKELENKYSSDLLQFNMPDCINFNEYCLLKSKALIENWEG